MEFLLAVSAFLGKSFHVYLLAAELLFCKAWGRRSYFWLRLIPCLIAYVVPPYFGFYDISWLTIGGWLNLSYIVLFLASLVVLAICFELKLNELLFYGMAAYAIQHITFKLSVIILMLLAYTPVFDNVSDPSRMSDIQHGFELLVAIIFYTVVYFTLSRRIDKTELAGLKRRSLLFIFGLTLSIVYILGLLISTAQASYLFYAIYAVTCCLLLLGIQFGLFERSKLERKNIAVEQILHISQKQHELSKENIELINRKSHDLRHQIAAIRFGGNLSDNEKTFDEIEKAINIYDASVKTGNDALDIILTEKSLLCEKYQIRLACIADGQKLDFMEVADIWTLFGNALENAINAIKDIGDIEKKTINLNISVKNTFITVHMDNYLDKELEFLNGLPVTTNADTNHHGFGMSSIEYVVKKYGGILSVKVADNLFQLNIVFSSK